MATYHCGCGWTKRLRSGVCRACGQKIISSDAVKREWKKYPKALTAMVDADIARKKREKRAERARKLAEREKGGLAGIRALTRRK